MESRTNSALFKRAEQLRRWEESETNKEAPTARLASRRIQFSDGCVFLSACAAGDKEEVVKLIRQGADIDTPNVDGLTALHQACIDDNLDMVEFLVEHGANINSGDHEGWTPLHATASCGFLSIARYLIEHNADVAAVNNDGELPIDIAETEAMEELLDRETQLRGIDCDAARSQEERQMIADTSRWLEGDQASARLLQLHPRTGATPLHVASAKGYIRVMSMLVQGGADLNTQDIDGWTPLHAASHWGQREACQLLCENMADMDIRNYVGQTCFDVADPDIIRLLEDCKKRQAVILRERPEIYNNQRGNMKNTSPKRRSSVTRSPQQEKAALQASSKYTDKVPGATPTIAGVAEEEKENNTTVGSPTPPITAPLAVPESLDDRAKPSSTATNQSVHTATQPKDITAPKVIPSGPPSRPPPPPVSNSSDLDTPTSPSSQQTSSSLTIETESEEVPSWRRPGSFRARQTANGSLPPLNHHSGNNSTSSTKGDGLNRSVSQPLPTVAITTSSSSSTAPPVSSAGSAISSSTTTLSADAEVTLRRAHSFESDERRSSADGPAEQTTTATLVLSHPNLPTSTNQTVRRSFVPPVRDEESETQRKAHAKRVRETRRSTQGVTLEEVKSAEQLAKKKQAETSSTPSTDVDTAQPTALSQQQSPSDSKSELERRPSWRLCINDNNKNKFSLEDSPRGKNNGGGGGVNATATINTNSDTPTTVTIPLRRGHKVQEEEIKETTKENAAGTPATIQRRRRPKRRSTGVVQIDMEDIDPSGKDSTSSSQPGDSEPHSDDSESLSDRGSSSRQASRPSSLGSSISDIRDDHQASSAGGGGGGTQPSTPITAHPVAAAAAALASGAMTPNGDIDYKKLWEESQVENERLRDRLRTTHEDLTKCKDQLENAFQVSNARNAMTEAEKRERRALERKLSEMEEELKESHKALELLRSDIGKMRDENGALIRVISKLSK